MSVHINWYLHCSDVLAQSEPYQTLYTKEHVCFFCSFVLLRENLQADILKTVYKSNIWHLWLGRAIHWWGKEPRWTTPAGGGGIYNKSVKAGGWARVGVASFTLFQNAVVQHFELSSICGLSAAAQLLWHQQGVITINLQQVEQEEPVSMGIQTHGPDALLGQRGIGAACHLTKGLENPVVLLQEKPRHNLEGKGWGFFFHFMNISSVPLFFPHVSVCLCKLIQCSISTLQSWLNLTFKLIFLMLPTKKKDQFIFHLTI